MKSPLLLQVWPLPLNLGWKKHGFTNVNWSVLLFTCLCLYTLWKKNWYLSRCRYLVFFNLQCRHVNYLQREMEKARVWTSIGVMKFSFRLLEKIAEVHAKMYWPSVESLWNTDQTINIKVMKEAKICWHFDRVGWTSIKWPDSCLMNDTMQLSEYARQLWPSKLHLCHSWSIQHEIL